MTTVESAAPRPAALAERRFALRDGRTAVVDPDDHVVILAADGGLDAESWCGVNGISYRRAVTFLTEVIQLINTSDKRSLVELVSFPLRASVLVKDRAEFLKHYDQIFPPAEIAAISHADPGAAFCRNGAFMLGDGEIWVAPDDTGTYRVTTVDPPVPHTWR